jgi:hypothetical protein
MGGGRFGRAVVLALAAMLAVLWTGSFAGSATTPTQEACRGATEALAGGQSHVDVLASEHRAVHARYELDVARMAEARDAFLKASGIGLDDVDTRGSDAVKTAAPVEFDRYLQTLRVVNDDLHALRMVTGLLAPALAELDRLRTQAAELCGDAPDAQTSPRGMLSDTRAGRPD